MKQYLIIALYFIFPCYCLAQTGWDDEITKHWPASCKQVTISSTFDHSFQPAMLYEARTKGRPLIVSLHTWSGDYLQADSLIAEVIARDWNYIHPNFRGSNNSPLACGSQAAVQDIDDAIRYAIQQTGANPHEVHLIGTSGGGYMTLMCYMKLAYPAKSFSSWVGISDLESWYYEAKGRRQKYANDILQCLGSSADTLNVKAAKERSPFHQSIPERNATLHLYAGIHDGYTGSVPIIQSLKMYNKVAQHLFPDTRGLLVSDATMLKLSTQRGSDTPSYLSLGGRTIHLFKRAGPVSLVVFEGNHEMIVPVGLQMIPVGAYQPFAHKKVLAIGDSNGASNNGWVYQLKNFQPAIQIIDYCKAGRTIGFDNNGDSSLNELRLIDQHLQNALANFGNSWDAVIIALGTNDAKRIFADSQHLVIPKFEKLLERVVNFKKSHQLQFRTIVVIPPPVEENVETAAKYSGANRLLRTIQQGMMDAMVGKGIKVVDAFNMFAGHVHFTVDGVHLTENAQGQLGSALAYTLYE